MKKILAVTVYAGSEKLVKMTETMLARFHDIVTAGTVGVDERFDFHVVAINNAAARPQKFPVTWHGHFDKNEGFGVGVNLAIDRELGADMTHVLVLNNDLEFPDVDWLGALLREREENLVCSPCTDVTATKEAIATEARYIDSIRHREVSAFCWLVPVAAIKALRKRFGFSLFHPNFSNYGSDDVTAACLRSIYGPKPFKIVPRSFVKHLKAKTANELGVKAGTPELLRAIANYKRSRRIT